MMIDKIRENVRSKLSKKSRFVFFGSRNQIEEFEGIIVGCYKAIFTVELFDNQIRSFSYSDLLIGSLKIVD